LLTLYPSLKKGKSYLKTAGINPLTIDLSFTAYYKLSEHWLYRLVYIIERVISNSKMVHSLNRKFIFGVIIIIVPILGFIFIWIEINLIDQAKTHTIDKARVLADNIILLRQWVTDCKGGVFIPINSIGACNMENSMEYNINTELGELKMFTPAMVTKKLSQYSMEEKLYSFRISSLTPVNLENRADDFERQALRFFKQENATEVYRFNDASLDFIVPLYKEKGCIECHNNKYCVNSDIIGGLRITIPFTETRRALKRNAIMLASAGVCITLVTIGVLFFLINKIVLKPLNELEQKSREIALGNLDTRVAINTDDEIEHLGRNFNMMASSLAQNRDRLEERVSKATRELAKANHDLMKLDTLKSDFLTNMSHELRTPLTAAKGGINYLARTLKRKDDLKYINIVDKNLSRLTWLITDLFDFTKLEAGKIEWEFEKEDISQLVEEVIEILSPIANKKNISIRFENPGTISALIDLERIEQVLVNILDNAIKFSGPDTDVLVNLEKKDKTVVISIKNHGPGIDEKHLDNIFEKFYIVEKTVKQNKKGTGLGLAISKAIVTAHKGRIEAESSPSGPTVFHVILPLEK